MVSHSICRVECSSAKVERTIRWQESVYRRAKPSNDLDRVDNAHEAPQKVPEARACPDMSIGNAFLGDCDTPKT